MTNHKEGDYLETFNDDWKELVCDENGALILDQVARELSDYSLLMECTSEVYCNIAGLSKPFTRPEFILDAINKDIEHQAENLLHEKIAATLNTLTKAEHNSEWDYATLYEQLLGACRTLTDLLNYIAQEQCATPASQEDIRNKLSDIDFKLSISRAILSNLE